ALEGGQRAVQVHARLADIEPALVELEGIDVAEQLHESAAAAQHHAGGAQAAHLPEQRRCPSFSLDDVRHASSKLDTESHFQYSAGSHNGRHPDSHGLPS